MSFTSSPKFVLVVNYVVCVGALCQRALGADNVVGDHASLVGDVEDLLNDVVDDVLGGPELNIEVEHDSDYLQMKSRQCIFSCDTLFCEYVGS